MSQAQLPEYANPPVREVVLAVHFKPLEKLGGAYIGLLWQQFRQAFPNLEQKDDLIMPRIEAFPAMPAAQMAFQLNVPSTPRIWFVNDSGTELLQVQDNRFSHNWRKIKEDDVYPRYMAVRSAFYGELEAFSRFLAQEGIGVLTPLQCEVTYINLIPPSGGDSLEDLLSVFHLEFSDDFLAAPESAALSMTFAVGEPTPAARLYIAAQPAIDRETGASLYQLSITFRGKPSGDTVGEIFALLDLGHEWIVRSFTSVTTPTMHKEWKRIR